MFQNGHRLIPQTWIVLLHFRKNIIWIISKKPIDAHIEPIFKDLQILKFSDTSLFVGKFMYFYKIDNLPNVSVKDMFLMTNQVHSYKTRNSNAFYCFPARTNIRLFGIRFQSLIIPYNRKFKVLLLSLF